MTLNQVMANLNELGIAVSGDMEVRLKVGENEASLGDFDLRVSKGQLMLIGREPRKRKKKEAKIETPIYPDPETTDYGQ